MLKKYLVVLGVVVVLAWSASAQDAKGVIDAASKAMGVSSLKTVQYSATGLDFAIGQAPTPDAAWPKFINKSYTRSINFDTLASRVDRIRARGRGRERRAIDGRRALRQSSRSVGARS